MIARLWAPATIVNFKHSTFIRKLSFYRSVKKKMEVQHDTIHTRISFGIAVFILCLLATAFISWQFDLTQTETSSYIFIGIPLMLAWMLSVIGLSKTFKRLKGNKTFLWYFGLVVNGAVLLTVMILLGINIAAIAKLFGLL
jgi:hypothetical protein